MEAAGAGSGAMLVSVDTVDSTDVRRAVRRLKAMSSPGPDAVPSYLVKDCLSVLLEPLIFLYNLCLELSRYPSRWKESRVTPIHKSGSTSEVSNYRPIAVMSVFAKIFETILNSRTSWQTRTQLTDCQHGFRPQRSTATNHVNFVEYVASKMDAGLQVDVAYFDYRKAFDRVNNDVLLRKLAAAGYTPKLLRFFADYFRDRKQYVQLAGFRSEPYYTRSGVSQGSILGPSQFLVMINDLPAVLETAECEMFADDLKLLLVIKASSDCDRLQGDIDGVYRWGMENLMDFNVGKCSVMTFTRSRNPIHYDYTLAGSTLNRVHRAEDLGLIFDQKLTFHDHIIETCKGAYKSLGFIMRQGRVFQNPQVLRLLYDAYVRSKLEYNALVWNPHEAKYILMVEKIQRKFNRFLYKKMYGRYPYNAELQYHYPSLFVSGMVGYTTLQLRRSVQLLVHFFLLLNGRIDNPMILGMVSLNVPGNFLRARRHLPFAERATRTVHYAQTPVNQALAGLNGILCMLPELDVFNCRPSDFQQFAVRYLQSTMYQR